MRLRLFPILCALCGVSACSAFHSEATDRPNLLFIYADDIGYETLNCYGGLDFETPHLNRMAADGLRFSRAYTSRHPAATQWGWTIWPYCRIYSS